MPGPVRHVRHALPGRSVAAALVSLPLIGVPMAAPAMAALPAGAVGHTAVAVDTRAHGVPLGRTEFRRGVKQRATPASAKQSSGVVLIDEVLDYGIGEAAGTGLVISHNGLVVTNHHVVADSTSIAVRVPGKRRPYRATVVGYDTRRDIAVLQLQGAKHLHLAATHKQISVGEAVSAVGNAEGKGRLTAAPGKVLKRRVTINVTDDDGSRHRMPGLIKDSSDVVPGDSGGALRDRRNRVVGMSVAATAGTKNVVGFAIPIGRVKHIAHLIIAGRASSEITIGGRAALGIVLDTRRSTPYIAAIVRGGAADRAGLVVGDVITSVGTTHVATDGELAAALAPYRPGQQVKVGWTDAKGAAHSGTVTLGTGPVG